jgi:hypothetical protein
VYSSCGKVEGGGLGGDAGGVMRVCSSCGEGGVRWGCRWSGTNRMHDPHDTGWLCELIDKGLNPLLLMNYCLIHVK